MLPSEIFLLPPPGETPQERMVRKQKEVEEKRISNLIDKDIRREKSVLGKQKLIRVLFLGQAESGKSTTLRNLRLEHAYADWVRERAGWRCVIQLNLIRSILSIIYALKDENNGNESSLTASLTRLSPPYRPDDLDSSPPPSPSPPSTLGSNENHQPGGFNGPVHSYEPIQTLLLKLEPLHEVERELKLRLGAASEEVHTGDRVDPSSFPPREFSVARWNNILEAAEKFRRAKKLPSKDGGNALVLDKPTEVISKCREDMKLLWANEAVRSVLKRKDILMENSAGFFLGDLDRVATVDYEPTDEDILRARLRTIGVQEYRLRINSGPSGFRDWIFYDVGGARTKRASWIPFCDNVNAIIFLAPVSTFDECLLEDPEVNRFKDSHSLWSSVCSSKLLADVALVLLLNKCDILKRKLKNGVQVAKYLTDYSRPNDPTAFLEFVKKMFLSTLKKVAHNRHRVVYCYPTTVIDKKATSKTLRAVKTEILRENLREAGIV